MKRISPSSTQFHDFFQIVVRPSNQTMAELALGALGVVPLIGFTIKSYTTLYTTLKTFRNCDSNVERLRKRLRGQRRIFENECLLLLRGCLQDSDNSSIDIEGMMADPAHEDWLNHELMAEDDLKRSLMHNYDECIALVQDIGEVIKKIQISMAPFEKVVSAEGDVSTLLPMPSIVADSNDKTST